MAILVTALLLFTALPVNAENEKDTVNCGALSPSQPGEISIWEAYAKGYAQIVSNANGISFIISNSGSVDIEVDEYAMLLSPNAYQSGPENPAGDRWAQDGFLTYETIPSGSPLTYHYADYVIGTFSPTLPPPPWWCTEDSEYTAPNVFISLTGEILPFDLWDDVENPSGNLVTYDRGDLITYAGETQAGIWIYLRNNAALVVGKTPMWKLIPNLPTEIPVRLAVTNIGFVEAENVVVEDILPENFSYKAGSFNIGPTNIEVKPDGSTLLQWSFESIRGAIQTGDVVPTDYASIYINYTLISPELPPDIRYFLPRAEVDKNGDDIMDAHSEEPLLETYFVNRAPVAIANDTTIDEGETAYLDAGLSFDPDEMYGDYIALYEWDLDCDGITDTTGQFTSKEYGDDGIYPVLLTVTDSYGAQGNTTINITVLNVAPTVMVTAEHQMVEVSLRVAGSKWSNVGMTLYEDEDPIGYLEVERWPGSPDDNPSYGDPSFFVMFNGSKSYRAVVTYDPYPDSGDEIEGDQPNNGKDKKDNAGNPVWIILKTEDGNSTKIHHTFNTQQSMIRDGEHWNHVEPWEVELKDYLSGLSIHLIGTVYDPGADDMLIKWLFTDGTEIEHQYPNYNCTYPVSITEFIDYLGIASGVTLTAADDDGGVGLYTYVF